MIQMQSFVRLMPIKICGPASKTISLWWNDHVVFRMLGALGVISSPFLGRIKLFLDLLQRRLWPEFRSFHLILEPLWWSENPSTRCRLHPSVFTFTHAQMGDFVPTFSAALRLIWPLATFMCRVVGDIVVHFSTIPAQSSTTFWCLPIHFKCPLTISTKLVTCALDSSLSSGVTNKFL
jgi:hypothetical protein